MENFPTLFDSLLNFIIHISYQPPRQVVVSWMILTLPQIVSAQKMKIINKAYWP